MIPPIKLSPGKKIYFASDFHLGAPNKEISLIREKKIIQWLCFIENDAQAIFLLGDMFDFWFEYRHAIPKGFIRLQGKLAELTDKGIPVYFFSGNHDMWMFKYFEEEMNIPVFHKPIEVNINNKTFMIGHGDGLGPGDYTYKFLKRIFRNKACQFLFGAIHPDVGMGIANYFSKSSRIKNSKKEEPFLGDSEWIFSYCKDIESKDHHDYYIFGHRHLPLDLKVSETSRYLNLGEWVNFNTYAVFENDLLLKKFE